MPLFHVRCVDCLTEEEDLWLDFDEKAAPCECGGVRKKLIGKGLGRAAPVQKLFTSYSVQGSTRRIETPAQERQMLRMLKQQHPEKTFHVEAISKAQQKVEQQERRHASIAKHRSLGREEKARKLEAKPLCKTSI